MNERDLTQIRNNTKATVTKILGGYGIRTKTESMGVRVGCEIEKISSQRMRGPVVVKVGNTRVAIGFGMAKKIVVSVEK